MKHTMRSAYKRWLILHNEEFRFRASGHIRIPNWFRYYIRNTKEWEYTLINSERDYYCNKCEMDYEQKRRFKGYYTFEISDDELLQLQRAEWIK
ncbi:MAG: hypothetical protein ACLUVX_09060 [Lachnospira pectinoschiza]